MTIRAIYENGVFRPTAPVALAENTEVEFDLRVATPDVNRSPAGMDRIYAILNKEFDGGDPLVSENHNQHQP